MIETGRRIGHRVDAAGDGRAPGAVVSPNASAGDADMGTDTLFGTITKRQQAAALQTLRTCQRPLHPRPFESRL